LKPEQKTWAKFRKHLAALPGCKFDRIEARGLSVGVPDVAYSYQAHHGWVELKALRAGSLGHWTPKQRWWLQERDQIGGYCWLLVDTDEGMFLLNARSAAKLDTRTDPMELGQLCSAYIDRDFDPRWLGDLL